MTGLRVDRTRAVRVAAAVGLALLVISILPGLLSPPSPPEVPANVGFSPAENTDLTSRPSVVEVRKPRKTTLSGTPRSKTRPATGRAPKQTVSGRKPPPNRSRASAGATPVARPRAKPAVTPKTTAEVTRGPAPAYVTPPPDPPPAPSPPTVPADGSQEFAPR